VVSKEPASSSGSYLAHRSGSVVWLRDAVSRPYRVGTKGTGACTAARVAKLHPGRFLFVWRGGGLTAAGREGYTFAPSYQAGLTQLVECQLPKLDVAGSNPVSRSEIL
jgi:hypothetical protein